MFNVAKEHARLYSNFEKCMSCIEDIIIIAAKYNNLEIGERISQCLESLEPVSELPDIQNIS